MHLWQDPLLNLWSASNNTKKKWTKLSNYLMSLNKNALNLKIWKSIQLILMKPSWLLKNVQKMLSPRRNVLQTKTVNIFIKCRIWKMIYRTKSCWSKKLRPNRISSWTRRKSWWRQKICCRKKSMIYTTITSWLLEMVTNPIKRSTMIRVRSQSRWKTFMRKLESCISRSSKKIQSFTSWSNTSRRTTI